MSDFVRMQLVCPNCSGEEFAVINNGFLVCEKCRKGSKLVGRYTPDGKEKVLEMTVNDKILRSDDKKNIFTSPTIKTDKYGRKECNKDHPYDYKGGQWYHPSAVITPANYDYFNEYYCPICDLTFKAELPE